MEPVDRDHPRFPPLPYGSAFLFTLALCGYAIAVVVASCAAPVSEFDDAIPLVHAALIRSGQIPSVDFWSFYPAAVLYVYAGLFSVVGKTVIAVRLVAGVLFGLVLFASVQVVRRLFPEARALAPLHAMVLGAALALAITTPAWPGYAVALLALLAYLSAVSAVSAGEHLPDYRRRLALAGALAGLALLCRVNFAGYVVFVAIVDLTLGWWTTGPGRLKQHATDAAIFLAALLTTFLTVAVLMYGRHVGVAMSQFIVDAARVMATRGFIDLDLQSARVLLLIAFPCGWFCVRMLSGRDAVSPRVLVPAACVLLILVAAAALRHDRQVMMVVVGLELLSIVGLHLFVHRLARAEFCLVLFSAVSLHYLLSRADLYHWRLLLTGPALLLPFFLTAQIVQTGTSLAITAAVLGGLLVAPQFRVGPGRIPIGAALLQSVLRHPNLSDADRVLYADDLDPLWTLVYRNKDERRALQYLRRVTNDDDPIFVGVPEQARVFFSNLRVYWLAERPIGVRAFQLETQVATEAPVQRQQIADVEQNRVNWMVIDGLDAGDPTFRKRAYRGAADFDQYVAAHFVERARFGRFTILQRARP